MTNKYVDHYAALGLVVENDPSEISLKDVNDAFKKMARKHHPDKNKGVSSAKFIAATQAIELLRDPSKREKFDEILRSRKREERRRAADDERTKKMRIDLERREIENELEKKVSSNLERLRRQTENIMQATKVARSRTEIKTYTFEQHLAMERDILGRALQYPI